jgi:hypothetical protein
MKRKTTVIFSVCAVAVFALVLGLTIFFVYDSGDNKPGPDPTPVAAHPTYVFELVRHGARAPLMSASDFPVNAEMLTP